PGPGEPRAARRQPGPYQTARRDDGTATRRRWSARSGRAARMPVLVLGSRASAPASSTKVMSFSPSCGPPAHGGEGSRVCYRPSLSYSEPGGDTPFRRMQGRRVNRCPGCGIVLGRVWNREWPKERRSYLDGVDHIIACSGRRRAGTRPRWREPFVDVVGARESARDQRPFRSPGDWGSTHAGPPNRLLETLSTIAVNHRGPPPLPRAELGIHGLNRWTVNCMEMYEKRGVQAARNGPSPSPCVARPEMSMADRLGSRERAAGATHFVTPMSACTRSTFISTGRASGSD